MATTTKTESDKKTAEARLHEEIINNLAALGGKAIGEKDVKFGPGWQIPNLYQDNLGAAIDFLVKYKEQMEEPTRFVRQYPYKPWDGAVAVMRAFERTFGTSGNQVNTMFSPAGYQTIPVGVKESLRVPYGKIQIPIFRGTVRVEGTEDEDGYATFVLVIDTPKKYEGAVEGLFRLIEDELQKNSIYRNKAIDGSDMPHFLDLSKTAIDKIIYSKLTMDQLAANLWAPIMYPDVCKRHGIDPKRANLLEGPYGTGKTLCAFWTAKLCEANNRTFIMCNPKDNNVWECLKTAQLYQPSCVFVEDIDKLSSTSDRDQMSRLLDEFDGLKAKGNDIMLILTTNNVGEIHKGMLRPGRMDAVIHIGKLDKEAVVRLIKSQFEDDMLASDINYDLIYDAMDEFTPAFMKEVCQKVNLYAISRTGGDPDPYTTDDFLAACEEMRAHWNQHKGAGELKKQPALDQALRSAVMEVIENTMVADSDDGFHRYDLKVSTTQEVK